MALGSRARRMVLVGSAAVISKDRLETVLAGVFLVGASGGTGSVPGRAMADEERHRSVVLCLISLLR